MALHSLPDAARILGLTRRQLRDMVTRRQVDCIYYNPRNIKFTDEQIAKALADHERKAESPHPVRPMQGARRRRSA